MPDIKSLITDNLGAWTSVIKKNSSAGRGNNNKISLHGIQKLRELILELAVRGKLAPRAVESFEKAKRDLRQAKIQKEKWLNENQAKRTRGVAIGEGGEVSPSIPEEWETCMIEEIAWPQAGFAFKSKFFNEIGEGLPLIRIRDVGAEFSGTYYDGEYRDEFIVNRGDILISMDGEFRVRAWRNETAILNQRVSHLHLVEGCEKQFITIALQIALSSLQGKKSYTTVDHLSTKQIGSCVIPFPSLEEQKRIIAKVDVLMALCEQLEQQTEESVTAHRSLVETLLTTLTQIQNAEEFTQNWARVAEHFDTLFTTEHSIDQLKQTILQLAVMGKLVPQVPKDQPASVLLAEIAVEKEKLLNEGKIKKQKPLPPVSNDEKPFEFTNGLGMDIFT